MKVNRVDKVRQAARDIYESDEIDIDPEAKVSWGENGAWVAAWVFVAHEVVSAEGVEA